MGQKLFDTAVYADKPVLVAADLVPIGDSAASTGGVFNNKTGTLTNLAAFVAANAVTLSGVAGVLTATAANLTISTATSGTLAVTSAGVLNLTSVGASGWEGSGGTLTINSTSQDLRLATTTSGSMLLSSAGVLTATATGNSSIAITSGNLTLSNVTAGSIILQPITSVQVKDPGSADVIALSHDGTQGNLLNADGFMRYSCQSTHGHTFFNQTLAVTIGVIGYVDASLSGVKLGSGGAFGFSSNATATAAVSDTYIMRGGAAATVQLGVDVNGSPVNQSLKAHNGITGTDIAAANLTVSGGIGTGAGAGGRLTISTATTLGTGTTAQTLVARVSVSQGAVTTDIATVGLASTTSLGWTAGLATAALDTAIYRSAATVLNLTTGASTDAATRLRVGIAGTAYTNAADTAGVDVLFTAQSGGAHSAANPAGGSFVFTPGAKGSGGSGADGKVIIRQPGGTPGTDEVQIYVTGGIAYIEPKNGSTLQIAGSAGLQVVSGGIIMNGAPWQLTSTAVKLGPTTQLVWTADEATGTARCGLEYLVNGVIGVTDGSTGIGWLQNTAGSSRVTTSDVTNVTTTPAAITGLSFTTIAGRKYAGRIKIWCEEATAADGYLFDLDGGNGTWTSFRATYRLYDTSSATAALNSANVTAIATDFTGATLTGAAYLEIDFAGVANAAGTFIPRFAKASDAAGAAFSARVNSFMLVEDVP